MDYCYASHTVFKIQYHFVFVIKYRYKVLKGDVGLKLREMIRRTCEAFEIEILKGVVSQDHGHVFVRPTEFGAELDQATEFGQLFESFPGLRKRYWGQHFWVRGYFCVTSGELTEELIKNYLEPRIILNPKATTILGRKSDESCGPYPDLSPLYEPSSFSWWLFS